MTHEIIEQELERRVPCGSILARIQRSNMLGSLIYHHAQHRIHSMQLLDLGTCVITVWH
jgi:hypothetical protein